MNCTNTEEFPEAFWTLNYTETYDGVACIDGLYVVHVILAYVCVAAGLVGLLARVITPLKRYHKYSGRVFMIVMYFVEGSAILIFNTGLPRAIIIFLTIMLFSMAIGYCTIRIHQERVQSKVLALANELQQEDSSVRVTELVEDAKKKFFSRPRTWYQRFFSLKALHGYLMTLAWYQMAGRAGVTNPFDSWDGCYVYPVYKELGDNGELVLLPGMTEEKATQQLLFATYITLPALFTFAFIGILFAVTGAWCTNRRNKYQSLLEMTFQAHVQAGNGISLFRGVDGSVWTCGRNIHGQLGHGHTQDCNVFERVEGLENIVQISCSWMHVLCLDVDGNVWGFGCNTDGQLGVGDKENKLSPVKIPNLPKISQVSAGAHHSLCLDYDGFIWGCGSNGNCQLARYTSTVTPINQFMKLNFHNNVESIHAGAKHTVYLLKNKEIYGCGGTFHGQLGQGSKYQVILPQVIPFAEKPSKIFLGSFATSVIDESGFIWVTGRNESAQLCIEPRTDIFQLQRVPPFTEKVLSVSCGHSHSFFLNHEGYCWGVGQNSDGQLGTVINY